MGVAAADCDGQIFVPAEGEGDFTPITEGRTGADGLRHTSWCRLTFVQTILPCSHTVGTFSNNYRERLRERQGKVYTNRLHL
jgi:hypothetical protein